MDSNFAFIKCRNHTFDRFLFVCLKWSKLRKNERLLLFDEVFFVKINLVNVVVHLKKTLTKYCKNARIAYNEKH